MPFFLSGLWSLMCTWYNSQPHFRDSLDTLSPTAATLIRAALEPTVVHDVLEECQRDCLHPVWPVVLLSLNASWARSVCCWCQFLNWKKYLCSCLLSTNGNKETPFPRSLPPSPDPQLSRYLCKHPLPLLCPADTTPSSEQARPLQEHHTFSLQRLWTERWWCITANHRQPYSTINGCKQGSPSPQRFSQLPAPALQLRCFSTLWDSHPACICYCGCFNGHEWQKLFWKVCPPRPTTFI